MHVCVCVFWLYMHCKPGFCCDIVLQYAISRYNNRIDIHCYVLVSFFHHLACICKAFYGNVIPI